MGAQHGAPYSGLVILWPSHRTLGRLGPRIKSTYDGKRSSFQRGPQNTKSFWHVHMVRIPGMVAQDPFYVADPFQGKLLEEVACLDF